MNRNTTLFLILIVIAMSLTAAGCNPTGPCELTTNMDITAYYVPDPNSDVFGTDPAGQTHVILARTADNWVGIDPGVAQAPMIGLARHRWFQLNTVVNPSCLSTVDLVTLADVLADVAASNP